MNKRDLARYRKLVEYGCVCCKQLGIYTVPEIHHIVDKGYRKHSGGNQATLPLCLYHHRGLGRDAKDLLGPSLAHGSRPFHAKFGSQRELLEKVNKEVA